MLNAWTVLSPGMRVKLIDDWSLGDGYQNHSGEMDTYLGQTVTIERLSRDRRWFTVEEDTDSHSGANIVDGSRVNKWIFDQSMVAEVVYDDCPEEEIDAGFSLALLLDTL